MQVRIPDSVTSIGAYAFAGCGLTSVTIPNSVTSIGNYAFSYCSGLADENGFVIVRNVIYSYHGVGGALTIPSDVTRIEAQAFGFCDSLTSVSIPASVTSIMDGAFSPCANLKEISVASDNTKYKSENGFLLSKDGKTLICGFNVDGDVTIPDGVRTIGDYAFYGCSGLTSVTIPNSVTSIGQYAFAYCQNLVSASLPARLKSAVEKGNVFVECSSSLQIVYRSSGGGSWSGDQFVLHEAVDGEVPAGAAGEYNGCLVDEDGEFVGTMQVKLGKPGKKDGKASATATVLIGTVKKTLKAADKGKVEIAAVGPTEIKFAGGEACAVVVGADGMSGYYGAYEISGSRNFFSSKDKAVASAAEAAIERWIGTLVVVWEDGNATVTIDKKGKAKVSVALSDGAKGSATASLLIGEEWHCVPVMVTKKMNVAFSLWLSAEGDEVVVSGLGDDVIVGRTGSLKAGAEFHVDVDDNLWRAVSDEVFYEYIPDGIEVVQNGAKWTLPKAGKLTMRKGVLDTSKVGDNPSGLKLTPKKDGTFTGSFKVYYVEKDKLKSKSANISGIVINGVGIGTATIKGVGSVPVTIE